MYDAKLKIYTNKVKVKSTLIINLLTNLLIA